MQTCQGLVHLSPENVQHKYGITPAEALILRKLHFSFSQGAPLSELVLTGDVKRSNGEEMARLKAKYTGIVKGVRAFEAVFGNATMIQLPQTFEEIAEELGPVFVDGPKVNLEELPEGAQTDEPHEWTAELQGELEHLQTTHRKTADQKQRVADLLVYKKTASNLKK